MGQTDKTRRRTPPRLTLSRNRVARTALSSTWLEPAQFIGTVFGTRSPHPYLLDVFKTKHATDLVTRKTLIFASTERIYKVKIDVFRDGVFYRFLSQTIQRQ